MSEKKCEHPEKLKGKKPEECSPEQIQECHGEEDILVKKSKKPFNIQL